MSKQEEQKLREEYFREMAEKFNGTQEWLFDEVGDFWLNKMKEQREKMIEEINSLFHEVQQDLMPLGNEDWKEGYNKALYDVLAIIKNKE